MLRVLWFANGTEHRSSFLHGHKHVSHLWTTASVFRLLMGPVGTDGPEVGDSNSGGVLHHTADLSWTRDTEKD